MNVKLVLYLRLPYRCWISRGPCSVWRTQLLPTYIHPYIHTCMHNSVFMKIIHKTCRDDQFIEAGRKAYIDSTVLYSLYVFMHVCMYVCRRVYFSLLQNSIELFPALNHPPSHCPHKRTRNLHTPMLFHIHYSVDTLNTYIHILHTWISDKNKVKNLVLIICMHVCMCILYVCMYVCCVHHGPTSFSSRYWRGFFGR